jgi:predicted nucleic acid-binding protein
MPAEYFIDTNILLYAYDLDAPQKRLIASTILEQAWMKPGSHAISVQVLLEFHANFLRKGHSNEEANNLIGDFYHLPIIDNTVGLFQLAVSFKERWKISIWDSMILAAANGCGARELLTEDLNHGQVYGKVRAVNPFC